MKKSYQMEELDCAHCAAKMENAIREIEGVRSASVNFFAQKLTIEFEDGADEKKILKAAQKACKRVDPECTVLF